MFWVKLREGTLILGSWVNPKPCNLLTLVFWAVMRSVPRLGASSELRTRCNLGCGDRLQAGQSGWGPAVEHWQLATLSME